MRSRRMPGSLFRNAFKPVFLHAHDQKHAFLLPVSPGNIDFFPEGPVTRMDHNMVLSAFAGGEIVRPFQLIFDGQMLRVSQRMSFII